MLITDRDKIKTETGSEQGGYLCRQREDAAVLNPMEQKYLTLRVFWPIMKRNSLLRFLQRTYCAVIEDCSQWHCSHCTTTPLNPVPSRPRRFPDYRIALIPVKPEWKPFYGSAQSGGICRLPLSFAPLVSLNYSAAPAKSDQREHFSLVHSLLLEIAAGEFRSTPVSAVKEASDA